MKYPYAKHNISSEDVSAVVDVLNNYNLTQGKFIEQFEYDLANYLKCKEVIVCSSGTAALHMLYKSIGINQKKGILTSPITFLATANAARFMNGQVYFSDVDYESGLLSEEIIDRELRLINNKIKALVLVHLGNKVCNLEKFRKIADKYNVFLIEDACHVLGHNFVSQNNSISKIGSGTFSEASCFSFHAIKNITTGEGGAIATNNKDLAKKIRLLRSHGAERDLDWNDKFGRGPWYYEANLLGYNYRLTDFQAALGISQLKKINNINNHKKKLAILYNSLLKNEKNIKLPKILADKRLNQTWHLYSVNMDFKKIGKSRNQIMRELLEKGIGTQIHYIPLYKQPIYNNSLKKKYRNTEKYYNSTLSLPMYSDLKERDIKYIVNSLKNIIS